MTTCKECASEISETEAFCPYCGIKIESAPPPVADIPVAVVDQEFESTIVITPGEAAAMKEHLHADSAAAAPNPPPSPFDPPPSPFADPDPVGRRTSPTLEDIPAPAILSGGFARPTDPGFSLESEATPTKESPVFDEDLIPQPVFADHEPRSIEEAAPGISEQLEPSFEPSPTFEGREEIAEAEAVSSTFDLAPKPDEAAPEAEPPVFESASPSLDPSVDDLPAIPEANIGAAPVFEASPATVEEPPDVAAPAVDGPEVAFEPTRSPVEAGLMDSGFPSELSEPEIVADPPASVDIPEAGSISLFVAETPVSEALEEPISISKPLEKLEDPVSEPSVFDSVRIMEGMQPSADNVDTVIPGQGFQIPSVIPTPVAAADTGATSAASEPPKSGGIGLVDTDGRKSAKLKPLPEGTVLNNRYEIVRKIGGGGMGAVYLASDNNLGGVLRAVKEMVQAHIEEDQQEKAINDFKRESMILSTLDHPSIPTIYDYFYDSDEGRFYLVMKYISGGDLASKLRSSADGKIEELTVTEWAIQITDVLNYLHNQPSTIVYRDLKPSNIMLDGNSSRVMLIDFGIARNISQKEEKGVTAVGTMGYAPPELFSGNVEPRSDIYSLGSTMFHLLTGADPQSNPLLIFDFQKNPRPRQINSRLSDQMERILMRTVEYNAESRFSSAAELKAVLEEHLTNLRSGNLTFGVTEAPVSVSLANQSVFCGFCGQRIVATDLFCAFCGAKQPIAQQGVHSEIYQKSAATARLVIEGTSELSAPIYALQKDDNLIGRRDPMSNIFPEVDLSKYDPQTKISRRHAKIWRDGTAFMLEDLGSSNGTIVEGPTNNVFKLPAHQPYKLSSGDRIKIGDTRLHFVVG